MAGHHPWPELTKNFTPEQRRRVAKESARLLAEIDRLEEMRASEKSGA